MRMAPRLYVGKREGRRSQPQSRLLDVHPEMTEIAVGSSALTPAEAAAVLHDFVRARFSQSSSVRVLEAGCGRNSDLGMEGIEHYLVGVDTDEDALRFRREKWGDLDEEIVESLLTVDLPMQSFDIAYCAWVLEHIEGAEAVLDRLIEWLKPGGLAVIRIPDGDSVYGWVTRNTPHSLHVLYKRWIQGKPNAGKPGFGPYPTVYDPVISLRAMQQYSQRRGLVVHRQDRIEIDAKKLGRFAGPVKALMILGEWLSLRRLAGRHVNLQFVLEKPHPRS